MGLDMYLTGEKLLVNNWLNPENNIKEDGFRLKSKDIDLGYWRKHPNLHGYIVENLANHDAECEKIYLSEEDMLQIIEAIKNDNLPHTEGFFFGKSLDRNSKNPEEAKWGKEEFEQSIKNFQDALEWLKTKVKGEWRPVYYQANGSLKGQRLS